MDKIKEAQYKNLRQCIEENLTKPILGENYYNMGMDVYTADKETTEDLKMKFDNMSIKVRLLKGVLMISLCINVLLVLSKLLS